MITEEIIKEKLNEILLAEASKVKRDDYNRIRFKIEELQNSINESKKDLQRLTESVPQPLKNMCNGRLDTVRKNLNDSQKVLSQLKEKIHTYKRNAYQKQIEERKSRKN